MAINDPRLELARRAAQGMQAPNIRSLNQVLQPGSAVVPKLPPSNSAAQAYQDMVAKAAAQFTDVKRRQEAVRIAQGKQHNANPGGIQGFLSDVLDNPIVKAVTLPLQVLDVPRRAVISGIHEISDAIGSGDASWSDFTKQVADPTYGVGRYIHTGNKWLDRTIGFVGDVALDPLTYATLGANEAAGASGRIALAGSMVEKGYAAERVAEVAKMGKVALTAAEIEDLGLKRSGVYFFEKRLGERGRIPGSGGVGAMTEKGLTRMRLAASDTTLGKFMQKAFTPNVNREARIALMRGELPAGEAAQMVAIITSRDAQRAASGAARAASQVELDNLARTAAGGEVRHSVYQVLDGAREALSPIEQAAADEWKKWFEAKHGLVTDAMNAADEQAGFGKITDYFPHMMTEDARAYMGKPESAFIGELKKGFDDGDPLGVFQTRMISAKVKDGQTVNWFGHKLTTEDLTVDRLNQLARDGGFAGDFFETDILKVADKYANQHAMQMGLAARYADLKAKGVFDVLESKYKSVTQFDEEAMARQAAIVKDANAAHLEAVAKATTAVASVPKLLQEHVAQLEGKVARVGDIRLAAAEQRIAAGAALPALERQLGEAEQLVASAYEQMHRIFDGAPPELAQAYLDDAARVQTALADLKGQVAGLAGGEDVANAKAIAKTAKVLEKDLAELTANHARMLEFNDTLARNWEKIAAGTRSGDKYVDEIGMALGMIPETAAFRAKAGKLSASSGEFQKWAKSELPKVSWWKQIQGTSRTELAAANVAALTRDAVESTLVSASVSTTTLADLRNAGAWVLARDQKFYGDAADSVLSAARDELLSHMGRAAEMDDLARRLAAVETRDLQGIQRASVELNVTASELEALTHTAQQDIETLRLVRSALKTGTADGDIVLDDAMKANLRAQVSSLSSKEYTVGQGGAQRTYRLRDFMGPEGDSRAAADLRSMSERFRFNSTDAQRFREFGSVAKVKADLADAMQHYYTVSDIQYRFNLAARSMAWTGMVPTEAMLRSAVKASAEKWATHWDARMSQLVTSGALIRDMRVEWARRAPTLANNPGAVADELRRMFDEAFHRDGGDALRQFVGPALAGAEDPKVMLRRIGNTAYRNDVVRPWYEANHGPWQNIAAAKVRLKEALSAGRSPFSVDASLEDVNSFFTGLTGGLQRARRASARGGGATVSSSDTWFRHMSGSLLDEIQRAELQQKLYHSLLDPELDVHAMVQGQGAISYYSQLLRQAADNVDKMALRDVNPSGVARAEVAAARKDVQTLHRRMGSVNYEIAMADEQLHQGIMDLARFDLWRASGPNGEPGFWLPSGPVVDASGKPLSFTREETLALFRAPTSEADAKVLRSQFSKVSQELGATRKQLEKITNPDRIMPIYVQEQLARPLREQVAALSDELASIRSQVMIAEPSTQSTALAKARLLLEGDTPWSKAGVGRASALTPSAIDVEARLAGQRAAHAVSPSRQFLDGVDALNQSATVKAWRGWASNSVAVKQHTEKMRALASQSEAKVVSAELAVKPLREALPLAAERDAMRAHLLELKASAEQATLDAVKPLAQEAAAGRGVRDALSAEVSRQSALFDSATAIAESADSVKANVVPRIEQRIETVKAALEGAPTVPTTKKGTVVAASKIPVETRHELLGWLDQANEVAHALDTNPNSTLHRILANALELESNAALSGQQHAMAVSVLKDLERGKVVESFWKAPSEGMTSLKSLGLPGLQSSPAIKKMMVEMQKIEQPAFARVMNQYLGGYTRFFKGYATLSPGFHVRNIIQNSYMMLASGANPHNLISGFKLWKDLRQAVQEGVPLEAWVARLPEAERAAAKVAADVMYASGGGFTSEQLSGMLRQGKSAIMDNKVLRASHKVGDLYESSSRFTLAYDSAVKGADLSTAAAKVKTFLFDYRDLSAADENLRQVVPFWIWMSRNLPLQLVNQWKNPRAYAIYNSFARNVADPSSATDITPSWISEQGGVKIGNDLYLRPDLGFNVVRQQLAEMGDPTRLLSYVNPGLRVPVEVLGGRQLYNDVPFSSTPQGLAAGPLSGPLGALAGALGIGDRNAQGQTVVDPRMNYILGNMIPPLAQAERLMPSTGVRKERQGNAWANYMGVPVTKVTPGMKESELKRRQREIDQLKASAKRLGYTP